jgi:low affinity Fe/Cu permease
VFIVSLAFEGFPSRWQMGFSTVSNAIVIMLLFALKHTQDRQQKALQLKLDELIRSSPAADDHLVQIERAEEKELGERVRDTIEVHESLRSDGNEDKR